MENSLKFDLQTCDYYVKKAKVKVKRPLIRWKSCMLLEGPQRRVLLHVSYFPLPLEFAYASSLHVFPQNLGPQIDPICSVMEGWYLKIKVNFCRVENLF